MMHRYLDSYFDLKREIWRIRYYLFFFRFEQHLAPMLRIVDNGHWDLAPVGSPIYPLSSTCSGVHQPVRVTT